MEKGEGNPPLGEPSLVTDEGGLHEEFENLGIADSVAGQFADASEDPSGGEAAEEGQSSSAQAEVPVESETQPEASSAESKTQLEETSVGSILPEDFRLKFVISSGESSDDSDEAGKGSGAQFTEPSPLPSTSSGYQKVSFPAVDFRIKEAWDFSKPPVSRLLMVAMLLELQQS